MKTIYKHTLIAFCLLPFAVLQAQVPNGGFENWTSGNPDNWLTNNATGFAIPVTQATPPYSGTYALKGDVVPTAVGPYAAMVVSTDLSGEGFAVTQAYATFSFYYKTNLSGSAVFNAAVAMYDASGGAVGAGGQDFFGIVSSYTLVNIPITYFGSNPVECIIIFTVGDTIASSPALGNYFIVDGLTLSGVAGVDEQTSENYFASAFPNPANDFVSIAIGNAVGGNAEIVVYDLLGNVVKKLSAAMKTGARFEQKISVADLPAGIYPVKINSGKKQWLTKIVRQ
ncbi:MAG TPA: T9SS type A sorting domain-containing protein [Bacteroidia bacterium]|nr:T9SS type A sorting domain-containing protein [Bacteroidia bacterium]